MKNTNRIVFIDTDVADYQYLISQLPFDSEVVRIHAEQDGVAQILAALQGKAELDAIDIISHGKPGALMLGSGELNRANLTQYAEQLVQLGSYLKEDGDILLYGCEVAQGKQGQAFIEQLSQLTGANIAASTNLTGAEDLDGDWVLAARAGTIQSSTLQLSYHGVLANIIGTPGPDILKGLDSVADTLTGGEGDDFLYGSNGIDVAIFLGNQTDYKFSLNAGGQVIVQDINPADGDEGTDTLTGIKTIRFSDGDITNSATALFNEFRVNTTTAFNQNSASMTMLKNDGYVVTWTSSGQDGSLTGVYGQRYDVNGVAQGGEFRVNTFTTGQQENASIAALNDGGFVVTWDSKGQDGSLTGVYGQRYDVNGVAQGGEFRVNTYTTSFQDNSSIAALSDGGFVVTWDSFQQDGSGESVYGQRYDVNGVAQGSEFLVNTHTTSSQLSSSVAAFTDGGFLVTWQSSGQDGSSFGIYGQRYDASGAAQGGEFQINTHTNLNQTSPLVAVLTGGGYVVTWGSDDNSDSGIFAQRYDSSGVALGSEFRVSTYLPPIDYQGNQSANSITALANGGFVITWNSYEQDGSGYGIFAQRFDANGVKQDGEFRVNTTYTILDQGGASTIALPDGGFIVSWTSTNKENNALGGEIYAQRFDANGRAYGDFTLTGSANNDHLTVAESMIASTKLLGMAGDDVLQGGAGNDTLDGGAGNDTLRGWSGADTMIGRGGNDSYSVENAGDIVTEGLNQGIDTVSSRLTFTLPANVENLVLTGASAINGTGNGLANVITGNSAVNQLNGGSGNDTLDGGFGTDVLTGGAGNDIFKFTTKGHTDTITDYNVVSDTIQLENAVFTALTTIGTLAADQFRVGAQALDANDFVIYNNATGALRYDADGSGAGAAVQIATVGIGLNLTNADIVVI